MQPPTLQKRITKTLALSAVMAALVAATTYSVKIPIPATGGYLNLGDIMIFVSALTFGPIIGATAGGIGSFISDIISGYAIYAPFTLIIKGIEGAIAGSITNKKQIHRDIIAVIAASTEMVTGYFLAELYPLNIGWAAATAEIPWNIAQAAVSAAIGIPIALALRKTLPKSWTQ